MLYLNKYRGNVYQYWKRFNFNKCCIWIGLVIIETKNTANLTLTSVVFEFVISVLILPAKKHLTLTSVVSKSYY